MRSAPSVVYPVGRSHWYGRCLLVLGMLGSLGSLWAVVWGLWALWTWRKSPEGLLVWAPVESETGQTREWGGWSWQPLGSRSIAQACQVVACLDLQSRQLLQLRVAGEVHWVWVEAERAPIHWKALRRALVSSRA